MRVLVVRVLVVQVLNKEEDEMYDNNQILDNTWGLVAVQEIEMELNNPIL